MGWFWRLTAVTLVILLASPAMADVIWTGAPGRGLMRQEVDILGVEEGQLVYLIAGNRATAPLERVQQIELSGDRAFSDAEQAYVAGDWLKAATGYAAAVRAHPREWVRRRAAERLITAASRAGQLEQAVTGYVQLTLLDPGAAVGREPDLPQTLQPGQLERAVNEVEQALSGAQDRQQQRALLTFLLSLQNRRGDQEAAGRVVERLVRVMGDDPGEDPKLYAQVLLGRAKLALSRGQLDEAERFIQRNARAFTDPQQQSEALMILAQTAEQRAGDERAALLDAAMAYMKVVAHFKRVEGAPNVPEALLRVGLIHERLGREDEAKGLYEEVVNTYAQSPAAAEAQRRLAALAESGAES